MRTSIQTQLTFTFVHSLTVTTNLSLRTSVYKLLGMLSVNIKMCTNVQAQLTFIFVHSSCSLWFWACVHLSTSSPRYNRNGWLGVKHQLPTYYDLQATRHAVCEYQNVYKHTGTAHVHVHAFIDCNYEFERAYNCIQASRHVFCEYQNVYEHTGTAHVHIHAFILFNPRHAFIHCSLGIWACVHLSTLKSTNFYYY